MLLQLLLTLEKMFLQMETAVEKDLLEFPIEVAVLKSISVGMLGFIKLAIKYRELNVFTYVLFLANHIWHVNNGKYNRRVFIGIARS